MPQPDTDDDGIEVVEIDLEPWAPGRGAGVEGAPVVDRRSLLLGAAERAAGELDRWQLLALRYRCRFGWPVRPGTSRTIRRSDRPVADTLRALRAADGPIVVQGGRYELRIPALGPPRRVPRELASGTGTMRLRWSLPSLRVVLAVGQWSSARSQLSLELVPAVRPHWPRRWFEVAHAALAELDDR